MSFSFNALTFNLLNKLYTIQQLCPFTLNYLHTVFCYVIKSFSKFCRNFTELQNNRINFVRECEEPNIPTTFYVAESGPEEYINYLSNTCYYHRDDWLHGRVRKLFRNSAVTTRRCRVPVWKVIQPINSIHCPCIIPTCPYGYYRRINLWSL